MSALPPSPKYTCAFFTFSLTHFHQEMSRLISNASQISNELPRHNGSREKSLKVRHEGHPNDVAAVDGCAGRARAQRLPVHALDLGIDSVSLKRKVQSMLHHLHNNPDALSIVNLRRSPYKPILFGPNGKNGHAAFLLLVKISI